MGYRLNRLDEPVFMAVSKPLLTEYGIHYRLESCVCFCTALQFFYLITEIYMNNGSLKEMQRWAYEIHSSFIVPGSPLQINPNLDQTAIDEIDR